MQRAARVRGVPFSIGVGYGLVAGLVGVAQWVLTQRNLAELLAPVQAIPCCVDGTYASMGNHEFWFRTVLVAAVVMLLLCWFAAFTAGWARQRPRDGVKAALVGALVSGAMYAAATLLAVATSPAPGMTHIKFYCRLEAWASD